jgi:hypothetical protein
VRRAWTSIVVAGLLVACEPPAPATFEHGVEHVPGPGFMHIEGDPITIDRSITVRFVGSDGEASAVSVSIPAGQRLVIDHVALPGDEGLMIDGTRCAGTFPIVTDVETDVRLQLSADGCRVESLGTHPPAGRDHEPGVVP